jgi:hypothetical protein
MRLFPVWLFIAVFLYACTPSGGQKNPVMEEFKKVDESLKKSGEQLDNTINKLKDQNGLAPELEKLQQQATGINDYIDSLIDLFKKQPEDDLGYSGQLMLNQKAGMVLHTKIKEFGAMAAEAAGTDSAKAKIASYLPLSTPGMAKAGERWEESYFKMIPCVAAMTLLYKFKLDVKNCVQYLVKSKAV